jgi:HD-GYP domain-containing protein (c-di-GMP phosphodiesterase class II)
MVARSLGQLCNLSERECLLLDIAGHLHDIGKLAIPLSILEKPDTLSTEEWLIMKRHTYFTYQILDEIDSAEFKVINEWAALHHEKLNGQGYPFKLSGKFITMGSRIMAIADTFTALAEMRPYRDGLTDDVIINILKKERGESLDTYIVDLLLKNYDRLKTVREQAFCDALKGFEDYFDSLQTA